MPRGRQKSKYDTFQICVTIIEAKHLEPNGNPMVVVRVGNRKKKTAIRKLTDNPYYNEYFVFDLTCNMDTLLSTRIELAVYLCGRLRRSKFHGNIDFEIATVWDQPDHQYYHKWAMLVNPKDLAAGPKGFVKCNIAIHAKGQKFKMPPDTDGEEDIEGNLLLPIGDARQFATRLRARYVFTIHRAEDLAERRRCHVRVSFAGMKALTSSGSSGNPRFNERIVFKEMFPPLCHRARISFKCHKISSSYHRNDAIASCLLNLKEISNSGEHGFLPTFGPSFLHLYAEGTDVAEPVYRGRLLLSLKTVIGRSNSGGNGVYVESVPAIVEGSLWKMEEYLLAGVIYDICMIDRSILGHRSVSFEISLGNAGNRKFSGHQRVCNDEEASSGSDDEEEEDITAGPPTGCASPDSQSEMPAQVATSLDGKYNCVPLGAKKPCIFVKSWWPNTEWRMKNTNRLAYIADHLESELDKLESLVALDKDTAYVIFNAAMHSLKRHCDSYLHSLSDMVAATYYCQTSEDDEDSEEDLVSCMTTLDKQRFNYCRREIEEIVKRVKMNGELVDNRYLRIAMLHAYRHLHIIKKLGEDPQHSLPDIFLWMVSGSRRLAYARLPARQVIFAEERPERGRDCGVRLNLFLGRAGEPHEELDKLDRSACKVELFLWLGNAKFASACWGSLPPGYKIDDALAAGRLDVFPRFLEYDKPSKFQLRAHIFQGRFEPGMDSSGLLDPMLRVIFQGYTMTTRVIKQTLDPFWDQTLVFPPIDIYGMREHVKNHPPKVVLEALDKDSFNSLQLYGRCIATPLVKLNTETYSPPDFPAKLRWHRFAGRSKQTATSDFDGAVLAALEFIEIGDKDSDNLPLDANDDDTSPDRAYRVPKDIRPRMASFRMEVIFWGVRDMRRLGFVSVHKPKIGVECAGVHVESEVMENAKKFPNFREIHVSVDLEMAEEEIYYPPITIKAYDSRGFGYFKYAGMCTIPSVYVFMHSLITKNEYESAIYHTTKKFRPSAHHTVNIEYKRAAGDAADDAETEKLKEEEAAALISYKKLARQEQRQRGAFSAGHFLKRFLAWKRPEQPAAALDKDESHDWWSKYYASLEEEKNLELGVLPTSQPWNRLATFKVYNGELEAQAEFAGFQDRLRTFELRYGKKVGDPNYDESGYAGKFKGFIAIYRWPCPEGWDCVSSSGSSASQGLLVDYPSQEQQLLLVRLYIVKAVNLRPSDPLSSKADPYLRVILGKNQMGDRKKHIPNQLNPTFGRVFEMEAAFPKDYMLTIQIWDYDATSADDLIGETRVDIESRFYSRHRAHCGLAYHYDTHGYSAWRDREKPSMILRQLCRRNNLPQPEYWQDYVKIGRVKFYCPKYRDDNQAAEHEERMALSVLHRWGDFPICGCALVPEHVERRPLFNPKRPGLEQGKLEMWIDMFPIGEELPVKPAIDITPQAPEDYELRVTVWNTEDVPLVDNQFLTGEKCSDIYVKGWIHPEDVQRTDVHYNSLTGEGNFNWRFVFRFTWARGENMMIVRKKASMLARDETEIRLPCKLNLQVWDSDHFSKDDFLGSLSLDLGNMPKGSNNARNCSLRLIQDPRSPRMSLFRAQHARAWWPLATSTGTVGHYTRAGKIEMEMTLLPTTEADKRPVGKGREAPEALPPPNRPDTSFSWFRNPWKACCFVVFRYYRWRLIGCCCCLLLVLLVVAGVYAFPGYLVKKLLGA